MTRNLKYRMAVIVALTLVCLYGIVGLPTSIAELKQNFQKRIRLGLDLKGGSHLVMQIQLQDAFKSEADNVIQRLNEELAKAGITPTSITRNDPQSIEEAANIQIDIAGVPPTEAGNFRRVVTDSFGGVWNLISVSQTDYRMTMKPTEAIVLARDTRVQTMNTIERKINSLGLAESSVQERGGTNSEAELLVQLPGVDDPARIKALLQTAAVLELFEVISGPHASEQEARTSAGAVLPLNQMVMRGNEGFWVVARTPVITGRDLRNAQAQQNATNRTWETAFVLTQDAAARFERFTGSHIGKRLAIALDRRIITAPVIESKIRDQGVINNIGTAEDAQDLAINLRAGSLPAGLVYLEERTVGPSLGADSIRAGMVAGAAGLIAVVAVMLIYYKRAGINATLALILNAVILIAVLAYFEAVLTLPGIAGIILTIGMAVDSNVLIFERIREELRNGKAVPAAVDLGFSKAFLTIIDTHVTTIVSCALLFLFGTGPVKGFAVTLTIGLLANLFTAVFVSRTMFDWTLSRQRKAVSLSI
jgi:preprotein translocase subunit SecD